MIFEGAESLSVRGPVTETCFEWGQATVKVLSEHQIHICRQGLELLIFVYIWYFTVMSQTLSFLSHQSTSEHEIAATALEAYTGQAPFPTSKRHDRQTRPCI